MRTPHIVPLSKPAVNLLRTLRLVTGHGPMLFSGLDPAGRQRAPQHPGVRIAQLCMAGRHLGHTGAIAAQSSDGHRRDEHCTLIGFRFHVAGP